MYNSRKNPGRSSWAERWEAQDRQDRIARMGTRVLVTLALLVGLVATWAMLALCR